MSHSTTVYYSALTTTTSSSMEPHCPRYPYVRLVLLLYLDPITVPSETQLEPQLRAFLIDITKYPCLARVQRTEKDTTISS
jgi:hypothetical protein